MSKTVKQEARVMTLDAIRERFSDGSWDYADRDWLFQQAENRPMPRVASDEIRETQFEMDDGAWECAKWLRALAAEVRDLNDTLSLTFSSLENLYSKLDGRLPN